jgi:hypothetical protein
MNKLKWWFRMVGAFYLLLTVVNLYSLLLLGEGGLEFDKTRI